MSNSFYLRSVHKRWLQVLAKTQAQVFISSPYLTPKLALSVVESAPPQRCVVYTRFSMEDFASGASSLRVVESLVEQGYPVFDIKTLHAKILLVSGEFASIGSQNLTARGTRNREATYCTNDLDEVAEIEGLLAPWAETATRITVEMVEDAKLLLAPIQAQFRKLQQIAADADVVVQAARARRDEQAQLVRVTQEAALRRDAEQRVEAARARHVVAAAAKQLVKRRMPEGRVSLQLAKSFIRRCTWWNTHSSGWPVQAGGFAEKIIGVEDDWQLTFGANRFLVGRAISRCHELLRQYIEAFESGSAPDPTILVASLRTAIRCSVVGYDGHGLGLYPVKGDDMHFGAHSIDVRYFIKGVLEHLPYEIAVPLSDVNEGRLLA